ncbi:TPA: hypothetical protein HA238_00195 [Candidatus Micrarchaeota archaeon]|nr:hypothetical protein [Candidatus Micrarchaeota archaeon]
MTFKTSFRNKLAVAGVLTAAAICAPKNVGARDHHPAGRMGLKEGIMTTISTEHADAFVRDEIRAREMGLDAVVLYTLFFAFIVPYGAIVELRDNSLGAKSKIDFREADGFACGGCGHEHGKKKGVST